MNKNRKDGSRFRKNLHPDAMDVEERPVIEVSDRKTGRPLIQMEESEER